MVVKNSDEIYARKKIEVTFNKPKESLRLIPMTLSIDKMVFQKSKLKVASVDFVPPKMEKIWAKQTSWGW